VQIYAAVLTDVRTWRVSMKGVVANCDDENDVDYIQYDDDNGRLSSD